MVLGELDEDTRPGATEAEKRAEKDRERKRFETSTTYRPTQDAYRHPNIDCIRIGQCREG